VSETSKLSADLTQRQTNRIHQGEIGISFALGSMKILSNRRDKPGK